MNKISLLYPLTILLFSLSYLTGCSESDSARLTNNQYQHSILQFGTVIDVTVRDIQQQTAQQAFQTLENDFAYWHKSWSPWIAGPLSRVNSLIPSQAGFNLPLHLIPLIQQSQRLSEQSEGLFNPAIGGLINLWKFHEHKNPDKQPPTDSEIQKLIAANPGMQQLTLSGIRLQSSNEAIQLNFGAFAKGYAIEKSIKTLQQFGIQHAVINAGGDLKVIGQHQQRPWRIGIRDPRKADDIIASLDIFNNESVFTSGDYERNFSYQGKRYHHILDPRTGYPATATQSVTVIHQDAGIADAAATALFVAGPEHWHRIAQKMGIKFVMLVGSDGTIHMNPAMHQRIQLRDPDTALVKLSTPL